MKIQVMSTKQRKQQNQINRKIKLECKQNGYRWKYEEGFRRDDFRNRNLEQLNIGWK